MVLHIQHSPFVGPTDAKSWAQRAWMIPSKLNCPVQVPTTAFTLTATRTDEPLYTDGAHAAVVADVHAVLLHASSAPSEAVGVKAELPKLSPLIVKEPPAVTAMLGGLITLAHGAGISTPNDASSDVRLGCGHSRPKAMNTR